MLGRVVDVVGEPQELFGGLSEKDRRYARLFSPLSMASCRLVENATVGWQTATHWHCATRR